MVGRFALFVACLIAPAAAFAQSASTQPTTAVALPAKERFHIYLLMGQSNMVGRDVRGMDELAPDPRVLSMDAAGEWTVARDPLHAKVGRIESGVGPGLSFARAMAASDPDVTIGLVPCAVGGTPLSRWVKGGDLHAQAVERARSAAKVGTLAGVLWHQGESDSNSARNASTYAERLTQMFADLREELGRPDLPIVVGQVGPFIPAEKSPQIDTVRAAIRHVAETVPNVGYADAAGLVDKGDRLHFDTASARTLGERFAEAMRTLRQPASATAPARPGQP